MRGEGRLTPKTKKLDLKLLYSCTLLHGQEPLVSNASPSHNQIILKYPLPFPSLRVLLQLMRLIPGPTTIRNQTMAKGYERKSELKYKINKHKQTNFVNLQIHTKEQYI